MDSKVDDQGERAFRPQATRLAFSITDVCEVTALGRTTIYAAIKDGALVARKHGRRTVVLADDLSAFLRGLPATKPVSRAVADEDV